MTGGGEAPEPPAGAGARRVVWRFLDGIPGHENQTLGLVRALSEHLPVDVHAVTASTAGAALRHWLAATFPPGATLPGPDLLIGAGHHTHLPMLAARRARGGRVVVLMKPSLPLAWFDLCVVPMHDSPPERDHVIATRGVLNAVRTSADHDPEAGLILVGGPSSHYRWNGQDLIRQIESILQRDTRQWTLATSRRTPDASAEALRQLRQPALTVVPWQETGPDWLTQQLARASHVWVSEDSVSMVYEALTCGAACGLLEVPQRRASRVSRGIRRLRQDGWITPFTAWEQGAALRSPPEPFNEARRCANLIARRWLDV